MQTDKSARKTKAPLAALFVLTGIVVLVIGTLIGENVISQPSDRHIPEWKKRVSFYTLKTEATLGYTTAQTNLGLGYLTGSIVPKNEVTGVYWSRKAAESGDAIAQYNLGYCYMKGLGELPKDEHQAQYWLSKSANSGYGEAKTLLSSFVSVVKLNGNTQQLKPIHDTADNSEIDFNKDLKEDPVI